MSEGGQSANQNARKRGWTSRYNPAPLTDITAAADAAIAAGDIPTLEHAERALRWRGAHDLARLVRQAVELTRDRLRGEHTAEPTPNITEFALRAPESIADEDEGYLIPLDGPYEPHITLSPMPQPARIARGYRR